MMRTMQMPPDSSQPTWLSRLLSAASEHAIICVDLAGTLTEWCGSAERRFGYTRDEAVGLDFGVLFSPEDREMGLDRQEMDVAAASGRSEDDRWHLRKDGSRFWGSGVLEAVREPDGRLSGYIKVMRDRTDVRTQVERLQNHLDFSQREDSRRSRLLALLGHEFRNVLGPLQNLPPILTANSDDATRLRVIAILQRQVTAMQRLVEDMEGASGAASSAAPLRLESLVVQDALESVVNEFRDVVERNQQELRLTLPASPIIFRADPTRLQQMLLNLLSNASKYTPAGGHLDVTVTVEASDVIIRIADDGIGIAHDVLPHIFDLFTRGGPDLEAPGLGIGLAVVKELATLHGGGVEARSRGKGQGSLFSLRLPVEGPRS